MINCLKKMLITLKNHNNKRPVGLYSPRTAGIITDFVIMMLSSINKME